MRYRLDKTHYHDFSVIEINRLRPRSYFIPYPDRASEGSVPLSEKRYSSPKVICLNGKWDFKFYPRPGEMPDILDTDNITFDRIDVPCCWQLRGYDRPFYVNSRYQFPFDPPKIPQEKPIGRVFTIAGADTGIRPVFRTPENEYNFAGIYRTFFNVTDASLRHEISFLGVASCIDLYINGCFTGYSEGSHNTAEFDISAFIHEGKNELAAVVRRWCTGSYLECQDMFRNNGIFRDVLLRVSEKNDIRDVAFRTFYENGLWKLQALCTLYETKGPEVTITFSGHGICRSQSVKCAGGKAGIVFSNLDAKAWNAEYPTLYDLYFEIPGTCVHCRVGFKDVQIEGTVFKVNGRPLKLKGVNHHDTSPTAGYYMTPAEIERDVRLCKEFNIDTIRTSHYPPDPYLLELCDEQGIYVIDEADIETHGACFGAFPPDHCRISNNIKWKDHYLDRLKAMYGRDKNHACVIMWSLGNEAGGYKCQDLMYAWIKKRSSLPVHYEGVVHSKRRAYDVASRMYPEHNEVRAVGNSSFNTSSVTLRVPPSPGGEGLTKRMHIPSQYTDRPYFMCEYLHAMGTGPGGGNEYWDEIYARENLLGGCVWEFADHAVLHEDGTYTYGGDHGEWEHDGNFCVDGIFYPDRRPSAGAYVIRHLYRPIRIKYLGGGNFELFNTCAFSQGERFRLDLKWSDGREETFIPHAAPLSREELYTDVKKVMDACPGTDAMVDITVTDTITGRVCGTEQIVFRPHLSPAPELSENVPIDSLISIASGRPEFLAPKTRIPVVKPGDPYTLLWRAPTDNDKDLVRPLVDMQKLMNAAHSVTSFDAGEHSVRITERIKCGSAVLISEDIYEATDKGVLVTSSIKPLSGKLKYLPRFGKTFVLDESFTRITYRGRSGETYIDMHEHFPIKTVSCTPEDMTEPNIRPQESGNREDCRFVTLENDTRRITFTAIDAPFCLGIKTCSERALAAASHIQDIRKSGVYVTLSAFMMGIGTGSCGPKVLEKYRFPGNREYSFRYLITIER